MRSKGYGYWLTGTADDERYVGSNEADTLDGDDGDEILSGAGEDFGWKLPEQR